MAENTEKRVPKNPVKFDIQLSNDQKEAKEKILAHPVNFILGKPGSGKTLLATQIALDKFFRREINKIVITRPMVATEEMGFLPGTLEEKLEPWIVPIKDNITKAYSKQSAVERLYTDKSVELVTLAHFRGRTFDDSVCIIDEFQNLTREQLSMCISRLGKNTIMIFTGDQNQIDLRQKEQSAFHVISVINQSKYVNCVTLSTNHRHEALEDIFKYLYPS
jgi:phosphate starvation-inducible PhoH-like protein